MKQTRMGQRVLSLALTGAMLLPSLTGLGPLAGAAAGGKISAQLEGSPISLHFDTDAQGWKPETTDQRLRLDIADNTYVVDDFSYTLASNKANPEDRYEIDEYGYLKLKNGAVPIEGEELAVTATVNYFSGEDVIFAANVVSSTDKALDQGANYYTITDTSKVAAGATQNPAQVARTGQYGMTTATGTKNNAPFKKFDQALTDVTFTAWYYDPVASDEKLTSTGSGYEAEAQMGAHINMTSTGGAASYLMGLARIDGGSAEKYSARKYPNGSAANGAALADQYAKTTSSRKEGWHRLTWKISSAGCVMSIDGVEIQTITREDAKTLTAVSITANKGSSTNNKAHIQDKHFMDDLSVVKNSAARSTGTITITIPVDYTAPTGTVITQQPKPVTVEAGAEAKFSVTAANENEAVTYQWHSCTDAEGAGAQALADGGDVSGAATAALTLSNTTVAQSGTYYYCELTGGTTTDKVKLTVLDPASRPAPPSSPTVDEAGVATFAYSGAGETTFRMRIYNGGADAIQTVDKTITLNNSNWASVDLLSELRALGVGSYTVTAQRLGGEGALDSEEGDPSLPVVLEALPVPTGLAWQGATLSWSPVEGANGYSIQLYKDGAASGDAVKVGKNVTSYLMSIPRAIPDGISATVTALADTKTRKFDSQPSDYRKMVEGFSLSMDGGVLHKGETKRVYLEGPLSAGIEKYTYSVVEGPNSDMVTIDQYGNISMKEDARPPVTGLEVTVKADVEYYPDTIWANNFEAKGGWAENEVNVVYAGGQAARTGRLGGDQTSAGKVGAMSKALGDIKATVVFWYYDAFSDLEQSESSYSSQTKFGMMLNGYQDLFGGVAYDISDGGNTPPNPDRNHYAYRLSGQWHPTSVARTRGWHKFEFRVTDAGAAMWIDGVDTGVCNTGITGINKVIMTTNWGNMGGNARYTNGQHFIDDVYVIAPDAATSKTSLTTTVTLLPKDYKMSCDTVEYDLNYPEKDVTFTVTPDLVDLSAVALNGQTLAEGTDYTVEGNVITLKKETLAKQAKGTATLTLTMTDGITVSGDLTLVKPVARKYYVSSVSGDDGNDGLTPGTAWKTLSKLNNTIFYYGDEIYLDAQSVWNEQLVLNGSGRPGHPITLTRYNETATHQRPVINGGGTVGTVPSYIVENAHNGSYKFSGAVELWNAGWWEISWLEVTNLGATSKNGNGRCGIMIMNEWAYEGNKAQQIQSFYDSRKDHVYITDCYVHDVNGLFQDVLDVNGVKGTKHSGGIIGFGYLSDFQVERCRVSKVDIEGIRTTPFHPEGTRSEASYPADIATTTVFRNNFIDKLHGDAIVIAGGNDAVMEYNVATQLGRSYVSKADGSNYVPGEEPVNLGTDKNFAAIWFMGCKNSLAQFNECYDTQYYTPNDGEAWDVDMHSSNCVYQYNYSHHNAGGCILFMGSGQVNSIFRYNLSIEDGGTDKNPHTLFFVTAGGSSTTSYPLVYNNIFTIAENVTTFIDGSDRDTKFLHFQNNIVLADDHISNRPVLYMGSHPNESHGLGKITGGEFTNNIIWPADLYAKFEEKLGDGVTVANNQVVNPKLIDTKGNTELVLSQAWTTAVNDDVNSVNGIVLSGENWFDAKVNEILGGFKLQADSPAIDKGVKVPYWSTIPEDKQFPLKRDFFGNDIFENDPTWVPDIGIQEYSNDAPAGSYKVRFNTNGGNIVDEPVPSLKIVVGGAALGALPTPPTRLGYEFVSWNTAADGTGDPVTAETIINAETTAYAQWEPGKYSYTVTYDKNKGDTDADPAAVQVAGPAINVGTLPAAPTREGYDFDGWNTKADGSGTAFEADTLVTGDITVYALWTYRSVTMTVTFDKNGGDTEANPKVKTISSPATTVGALPKEPTRAGYEFNGWNTAADGTGSVFTARTKVTGDMTVYAQWKLPGSFTVTYNKNGGDTDANPAFQVVTAPETTVGTLPAAPERSGYTFTGWNTKADGTGEAFDAATAVVDDITVYAQWEALPGAFIVTYDKNGGDTDADPATQAVMPPATTVGTLPAAPERSGYIFTGWNTAADGTGNVFDANTAVSGDITVYAQWQLQPVTGFTVTYDKNGGDTDANPATQTVTPPATTVGTLPAAPERSGYTFTGWNTAADGTGSVFDANTAVSGSMTVYAQWEALPSAFIVTYDKNGGDTDADPTEQAVMPPATTVGTLPAAPSRNGYTFTGWNTAADGTGSVFDANTTVSGDITVYAQWQLQPVEGAYTVTYNKNGGDTEANPAAQTVTPPATTVGTLPTAPTRSGYDFMGWNTKADGTGTYFTVETVVNGDMTVYAQWRVSDNSSGGDWGGGSGSSDSNSGSGTTDKNEDGSTTETVEDKTTGTVTETTKYPDGSVKVTETKKDGTVTEKQTSSTGVETTTTVSPDGSAQVSATVPAKAGEAGQGVVVETAAGSIGLPESLAGQEVSVELNIAPVPEDGKTIAKIELKVEADGQAAENVSVSLPVDKLLGTENAPAKGSMSTIVAMSDGKIIPGAYVSDGELVAMLDGNATITLVDNQKDFVDVKDENWAKDGIDFVAARELFSGTGKDTFSPAEPMSRAMLWTVLARLDGQDTTGGQHWYSAGLVWAEENGVSDGTNPEGSISREQLAVMLWRYAGLPGTESKDLSSFQDGSMVSGWAGEAMAWAVEQGILQGAGGNLNPAASATRAEVATLLTRFITQDGR